MPKSRKALPANPVFDALRERAQSDLPGTMDSLIKAYYPDDNPSWDNVAFTICTLLELPDLYSRSGLKEVHADFDNIQKKLETAYTRFNRHDRVAAGLVRIWATMSVDAVLRNRFLEGGLMKRILPLLDKNYTRTDAMFSLSLLVRHGDVDLLRQRIANHIPKLVRIMEKYPDDKELNELAIMIVALTASAIVVYNESSQPAGARRNMKVLDMPTILRLILKNARQPDVPADVLGQLHISLSNITPAYIKDVEVLSPLVSFLVSGLRSKSIIARCRSLRGIIGLKSDAPHADTFQLDHAKFTALFRKVMYTPQLGHAAEAYGFGRCDMSLTLAGISDFWTAMGQYAKTRDLCELGRRLSHIVLRTENAVGNGIYCTSDGRYGELARLDGSPVSWLEVPLQQCLRALRGTGNPDDLDCADVLQCREFIRHSQSPAALALATKATTRSPHVAYFYYVVAASSPTLADRLKAAKKGLKCAQTTPYVRSMLLWHATEHAANMGIEAFRRATSQPENTEYWEGTAFLTSALEDAEAFISEAPPDIRRMGRMVSWYILLTIVVRGPELSLGLKELDFAVEKFKLAEDFWKGFEIPLTNLYLTETHKLIMEKYKSSCKEWSLAINLLNQAYSSGEDRELSRSLRSPKDRLAAWLEGMSVEDEDPLPESGQSPKTRAPDGQIFRCAYCGNISAMLRKCGGCGTKRYCDSECQKSHWSEHKVACKQHQATRKS